MTHTVSDAQLLLGIAVLILVARLLGDVVSRWLRQPRVIGEVATGILLGPTVLGALPGDPGAALFPPELRPTLVAVGTLGVVLYVFLMSLDLELHQAPARRRLVAVVAGTSFVVPFALGIGLGIVLWTAQPVGGVALVPFALFVGTALAVTAFPVLARIVEDYRLGEQESGRVALGSAALQEPVIWLALAVSLLAFEAQSPAVVARMVAGALGFAALLSAAAWVLVRHARRAILTARPELVVSVTLSLVCGSAAATAALGFHPIIGALAIGLVVARLRSRTLGHALRRTVDPLTRTVLLPVFLATPGLSVNIGSLPVERLWQLALAFGVACAGKAVTAGLAARWAGMDWRESALVGSLMNTRGLVELVVLNVGFSVGLIDDQVFTMLLIVALVTTAATGPLVTAARRIPSTVLAHRQEAIAS